jgi:hypothetical protein
MTDSKPVTALASIYVGQKCVGQILRRPKQGTEAFDADDKSLGIFEGDKDAANAIVDAAAASVEEGTNG